MKDDLNERRPKLKTTKMEDDQNGSRPKWKTTKMEDDQSTQCRPSVHTYQNAAPATHRNRAFTQLGLLINQISMDCTG